MCGLRCFHVDYDIWSQMWDTVLDIMFSKEQLIRVGTVLPAKSDSDVMFCLQSYQGLTIDRSLVY